MLMKILFALIALTVIVPVALYYKSGKTKGKECLLMNAISFFSILRNEIVFVKKLKITSNISNKFSTKNIPFLGSQFFLPSTSLPSGSHRYIQSTAKIIIATNTNVGIPHFKNKLPARRSAPI